MTQPTFAELAAAVYVNGVAVDKADVRAHLLTIETALNALFSNDVLVNGKIAPSVASNALTIAVKTLAGADPSATDPVYFVVRSATAADGAPAIIAITAPTSLTVSADSTLATLGAVPFRLWLGGFNDAGTFRLGVANLYSGGVLYPLDQSQPLSATAEGGAGNADSAGVIYAGATVAAKGFRLLASLTWETALATAGLWSAAPDTTAMLSPGMALPGGLVQRQRNATGATASGTTVSVLDDSIPQSGEGVEFLTQAITPKSAANLLRVRAKAMVSSTVAAHLIAQLHQDSVADALAARAVHVATTNIIAGIEIDHLMLAGTIVATTFKLRVGPSTAATVRLNGVSGARIFGGVGISSLEIEELVG